MTSGSPWSLAAVAVVCGVVSVAVHARAQPAARPDLRVVASSPNGPTPEAVTQATIRFSEPMVPLGAAAEVDQVAYVRVEPAVDVSFRWPDTNVLVITPRSGRFPFATTFTVRVEAGATSASGRRLPAAHTFTFSTPPPRLMRVYLRDRLRNGQPPPVGTELVAVFDQTVRVADLMRHLAIAVEPDGKTAVPALSPAARERLARTDPDGLRQRDAFMTRVAAAQGTSRPMEARLPPRSQDAATVVIALADEPPPGALVTVTHTGAPSPEGPLRRGTPDRVTVATKPLLSVSGPDCGGPCDPETASLHVSSSESIAKLREALTVTDITDPTRERVLQAGPPNFRHAFFPFSSLAFLGYTLEPGRRYAIRVDGSFSAGTQRLGAPWMAVIDVGFRPSLVAIGADRLAVWEAALGPRVPVLTRSLLDLRAGVVPVPPGSIVGALQDRRVPAVSATGSTTVDGALGDADREAFVDVSSALSPGGTGVVRLAVDKGTDVPGTARQANVVTVRPADYLTNTLIQVTNIGVTVRGNAGGLAVFAARYDTGEPIPDADVTVLDNENVTLWHARTDANGLASATPLPAAQKGRIPRVVVVQKAGDTAFAELGRPMGRDQWYAWVDAPAEQLVGVLFTDRGVYRPGERVRVKALMQLATPRGLRAVPARTPATLTLTRDGDATHQFGASIGATGGAEWTVPIPEDTTTDTEYELTMRRGAPDANLDDYEDTAVELRCRLLIKAVRPVEFRIGLEATAALSAGPPVIDARLTARDLSDVALSLARVEWTVTRRPTWLPQLLSDDEDFEYRGGDEAIEESYEREPFVRRATGTVDGQGELGVRFTLPEGLRGRGTFEIAGQVRDTSSQIQAARAEVEVLPEAYLGLGSDADPAPDTVPSIRVVARTATGSYIAGVPVELRLRAREDADRVGTLKAVTGEGPVRVPVPAALRQGWLEITARSTDSGRAIVPADSMLFIGPDTSPSAPATSPTPILTMSLDRERYQPGDRAHLRIVSAWPRAMALVTLERGAVLESQVVRVVDGAAAVDLGVGDSALAGLSATVTLVRGRTSRCCAEGTDDPGQPSSVWASIPVPIDREATRLSVAIEAPASARPGARTAVRVTVRDRDGRPVRGEVTLWAVDEGILALTGYAVANPQPAIYEPRWPWLSTSDTRALILSRRLPPNPWHLVQTSAASTCDAGSAEGQLSEDAAVRRDLRPLAFWHGAADTGADGVAEIEVTLPDTLTTYRVMAVAADATARYGLADAPLLVAKPVMVRPAMPRFLTRLDTAELRSTVAASGAGGTGRVVVESLTPALLRIDATPQPLVLADGARMASRVRLEAHAEGVARVRVTATLGAARDVVERDLPVVEASVPETAAAAGQAAPEAIEMVRPPAGADPNSGGLDIDVASTMLVGLSAAGDYVGSYPYLCAEQVASRALVLVLKSALGPSFTLAPGPATTDARRGEAQRALAALAAYRCDGGYGYAYWAGDCRLQSPYLTAYVLFVLETAATHGYEVPAELRAQAVRGLGDALLAAPGRPSAIDDVAWRAFVVKVLVDAGQKPEAAIDALYGRRDELPIFAIAHLFDAIHRLDATSPRLADLERRLRNAMTAGVSGHVEERSLARYAWCWPSNTKSTAVVLDVLGRAGVLDGEEARSLVAWLLRVRRDGIWSGTQENVWALLAIASYQRAFEPAGLAATATVSLDGAEVFRQALDRQLPTASRALSMADLRNRLAPGATGRLTIASDQGRVFYTTRLGYRLPARGAAPLEHGMAVTRRYVPVVHGNDQAPGATFAAGDLVRVVVTVRLSESRTFVAVTDALPGGFEVVDTALATTAVDGAVDAAPQTAGHSYWREGFDRTERYDRRVDFFATSLRAGTHTASYLARATTPGTFFAAPTRAEAMYEPEIAGRSEGSTIVVTP